jgi:hypothetical protein
MCAISIYEEQNEASRKRKAEAEKRTFAEIGNKPSPKASGMTSLKFNPVLAQ